MRRTVPILHIDDYEHPMAHYIDWLGSCHVAVDNLNSLGINQLLPPPPEA